MHLSFSRSVFYQIWGALSFLMSLYDVPETRFEVSYSENERGNVVIFRSYENSEMGNAMFFDETLWRQKVHEEGEKVFQKFGVKSWFAKIIFSAPKAPIFFSKIMVR